MKDSDYKNKGMKLIRLTSMAALLLLMVGLMVSSAGSQPVRADNEGNTDTASDGCMQDVAGFGLNCTANDIQIAGVALDEFGDPKITIIDDGCAFPGDTVTFTADFEVLLTAQARHDIGMWFATDGDPNGDGAYTGQCTAGTPAYAPDPPWLDLDAAPGTCTLRSTLGCDANSDCAGGGGTKCNPDPDDPDATVNTCSNDRTATCSTVADCNFGTCDLNAPLSGDTCGDIDSAHNPLFPSMTITAQCIAGPDGNLSLPNCTSWRQPGANDLCTSPLNAYPGAPSKCNCDKGFTVPIRVPGFITVDKVTIDANGDPLPGDPTLFGFSITGPTFGPNNAYLPDNFSLKDADAIHTSPPLDTTDEDNNVVGPYQITESTPPAGWELESASCTRDYGTPNDTSDDTTFLYTNGGDIQPLPGEVVACAFTNMLVKVAPKINTVATGLVYVGEDIQDTANLSAGNNPTGTITFNLYGPDDATCSADSIFESIVDVDSGNGTYNSGTFTTTEVGSYYWTASYSGDDLNEPVESICNEPFEVSVVTQRSPSITTLASWTGETVGNEGTVGDSATFVDAYNPTGQIDFTLYSDAACTVEVLSGSGVIVAGEASYSQLWTPTAAGTYYWIADYAGDTNNEGFTTSCGDDNEDITVDPRSPSITTLASWTGETVGNEGTVGDSATFVDAYNPTGQIDFTLYSDAACTVEVLSGSGVIVAGEASYSQLWTPTAAGTYYWIADYAGDTNNEGFTTSCGDDNEDITVDPRSPSITTLADPTNAVLGQEINVGDTATLHDAYNPTGQIDFTLYSDAACTEEVLSGSGDISGSTASYFTNWTFNQFGTYYWIAHYDGDINNESFTTSCGDANEMLTVAPPIAVTDSALCDFGGTFRNIFSMDPKLVPWYKDTATNPGQFYYNLSVTGTPGEVVPVTLSIPWPFVTQGARPVHVYDGVAYDTSTGVFCFDPDEFNELAAIDNYIVLSDYGVAANTSGYLNGVSEQYVEVELLITIPDTGFAYINQHMDYGLKGLDTDFDGDGTADPQHYVKDANDDALLPDYATPSSAVYPPVVLIPEMAEHPFCTYMGEGHDPDLLGCDTAYKDNDWKFNPGISGMVLEVFWNTTDGVTYEEGIEGAKVELLDRKGNLVGTDYSDEDGWYQIVYKHIGRPSDYTFRATLNGTIFERVVKLSGNEFEEVNVYLDSTNGAAADYAHIGEMSGSAKYLNKNWNATVSIQVVDQDGVSIANAQVSGNWDFGDPGLCITDLTGWCTVSVTKLDNSLPSVTFSVLDVAAEGYLYDPAANFNDPAEFTVDGP